MLGDITQAYTQSKTELNYIVICYLPTKLNKRQPENTILRIIYPLHDLAEVENHQFATYLDHHKEKLRMEMSPYDACFFITKNGGENFGIAKLQIDNTFNVGTEAFIEKKETEMIKAKFKAKNQTILETSTSRYFNGCCMTIEADSIIVMQKNQAKKFVIIDIKNNTRK